MITPEELINSFNLEKSDDRYINRINALKESTATHLEALIENK